MLEQQASDPLKALVLFSVNNYQQSTGIAWQAESSKQSYFFWH